MPRPKATVTMRLDADLLEWFRRERGYQTRINAILRAFMNAHTGNRSSGIGHLGRMRIHGRRLGDPLLQKQIRGPERRIRIKSSLHRPIEQEIGERYAHESCAGRRQK